MKKQFSDVKALIWDFDGTLFEPNQGLHDAMREAEYRVIMHRKQMTKDQAVMEFTKYYKKISPSGTKTVAYICNIPTSDAAHEMEGYFNRRAFLSRDEKLLALFQKLNGFTHYILANGIRRSLEDTLGVLGLSVSTFKEIVTSEIAGENKPDDRGFRYIMSNSGLPASAHMMIGDREAVDLAPAKSLGMHTCLVWSDVESSIADVTLPTVYDVAGLFS